MIELTALESTSSWRNKVDPWGWGRSQLSFTTDSTENVLEAKTALKAIHTSANVGYLRQVLVATVASGIISVTPVKHEMYCK